MRTRKQRKNYIVATVQESQAIDFTKIYKITPVRTIRPGTPLRFDTAEDGITTDFPVEE